MAWALVTSGGGGGGCRIWPIPGSGIGGLGLLCRWVDRRRSCLYWILGMLGFRRCCRCLGFVRIAWEKEEGRGAIYKLCHRQLVDLAH